MLRFLVLLCFSLSLGADNTLQRAFEDGNFNVQMQLFYYNIEKKHDSNAYATSAGGYLKYTTDANNPFFASVRFHTSNPVLRSKNRAKTSLFKKNSDASSLTTISESFLAYKTKSRMLRVGQFIINTPMMNDVSARIVPWSYRGFTYTGEIIKNLKVQLYYIDAIRSHTSDRYTKESGSGQFKTISMLSFHYNGLNGIKAQAYYYHAPELYSTFVAQGDYEMALDKNTLICFGTQYFRSFDGGKYNNRLSIDGGDDINLVALRSSIDAKDWSLAINYSQNFGLSGVGTGYGGSPSVYTSSMIANGRDNFKPETWMLKSTYELPFTKHHSELALILLNTQAKDARGEDFNSYYLHFKHFFTRDASIYLRYERLRFASSKRDANYFRAIANYRF